MNLNDFDLRPSNVNDKDMILSWRNSDEVRSKMYESTIISPEVHNKWFSGIKNQDDKVCLIFE